MLDFNSDFVIYQDNNNWDGYHADNNYYVKYVDNNCQFSLQWVQVIHRQLEIGAGCVDSSTLVVGPILSNKCSFYLFFLNFDIQ